MTKRNIEIKVRLSRKEAENLNKQVKKCRLSREADRTESPCIECGGCKAL